MTDQPYEGGPYEGGPYEGGSYEGYELYRRQQAPQAWPSQAGYDQSGYDQSGHHQTGYDQSGYDQQYTQQWQGQTWDTQMPAPGQAPAPAAETAYLPPQQYEPVTPAYAPPAPEPQAPEPESSSGYGPATLAGNARVTDAQRARLEGRSPVIEPGMQPAALTALLGLLLSGTAAIGTYALVVPLVLLQAVTAACWFRLNGMWPARQGIALAFAGALTADVAVLAAGREHAPAAILGPLGVWVLLSLVLQLRSHASPDERMYG